MEDGYTEGAALAALALTQGAFAMLIQKRIVSPEDAISMADAALLLFEQATGLPGSKAVATPDAVRHARSHVEKFQRTLRALPTSAKKKP